MKASGVEYLLGEGAERAGHQTYSDSLYAAVGTSFPRVSGLLLEQ